MTYSEFRSNIFQCLEGNDDDCVGYDTIIESLKNDDSMSQISNDMDDEIPF